MDFSDCGADSFRLLLEFAYGNVSKCLAQLGVLDGNGQIELVRVAEKMGLAKLIEAAQRTIGQTLDGERLPKIYAVAKVLNYVF